MAMMSNQEEKPDYAVINNAARSVGALFLDRVSKTPDRVAFEFPDADENWHSLTWAEVAVRSRHIAAGLISLGVEMAAASRSRVRPAWSGRSPTSA